MIKSSVVAAVLFCTFTLCQAADPQVGVAKIDMSELEPLLLEQAFAKPENYEIRDRYVASQERERAFMSGDEEARKAARSFGFDQFEIKPIVEDLAKAELIVLIEDMFGDRYQLIINDGYGGGILYTSIAIPDITPNIRQRLLKDRLASQVQPQETPEQDTPTD